MVTIIHLSAAPNSLVGSPWIVWTALGDKRMMVRTVTIIPLSVAPNRFVDPQHFTSLEQLPFHYDNIYMNRTPKSPNLEDLGNLEDSELKDFSAFKSSNLVGGF